MCLLILYLNTNAKLLNLSCNLAYGDQSTTLVQPSNFQLNYSKLLVTENSDDEVLKIKHSMIKKIECLLCVKTSVSGWVGGGALRQVAAQTSSADATENFNLATFSLIHEKGKSLYILIGHYE